MERVCYSDSQLSSGQLHFFKGHNSSLKSRHFMRYPGEDDVVEVGYLNCTMTDFGSVIDIANVRTILQGKYGLF